MGYGLFAERDFKVGENIFCDTPMFVSQHTANRRFCNCCANCQMFIGGPSNQIHTILNEPQFESTYFNFLDQLPQLNSLWPKGSLDVIRCCCGETYCSEKCKDEHFNSSHSILCCGLLPGDYENQPLMKFKFHAIEYCDTMIVLAQVFSYIINKNKQTGVPIKTLKNEILQFHNDCFIKACRPPQGETEKSEEFINETKEILTTGYTLLRDHFYENNIIRKEDDCLFLDDNGNESIDFFSRILGMFELNNIDVEITNPLTNSIPIYMQSIKNNQEKENKFIQVLKDKEVLMRLLWDDAMTGNYGVDSDDDLMSEDSEYSEDCIDANNDDNSQHIGGCDFSNSGMGSNILEDTKKEVNLINYNDLNKEFPNYHGSGFCPLIARCNHSCLPNSKFYFDDNKNKITMKSVKDIKKGDEIMICYINDEDNLKYRRKALIEYGFHCNCIRCIKEENNEKI